MARIRDEEGAVEGEEGVLDLLLGGLIDVLLEVGDDGLGEGLAEGVDLRGLATTLDAEPDVDTSEALTAEDQDCRKEGKNSEMKETALTAQRNVCSSGWLHSPGSMSLTRRTWGSRRWRG